MKKEKELKIGDRVRLKSTGKEGVVVGITGEIRTIDSKKPPKPDKYRVRIGGRYRVNLTIDDLERI